MVKQQKKTKVHPAKILHFHIGRRRACYVCTVAFAGSLAPLAQLFAHALTHSRKTSLPDSLLDSNHASPAVFRKHARNHTGKPLMLSLFHFRLEAPEPPKKYLGFTDCTRHSSRICLTAQLRHFIVVSATTAFSVHCTLAHRLHTVRACASERANISRSKLIKRALKKEGGKPHAHQR